MAGVGLAVAACGGGGGDSDVGPETGSTTTGDGSLSGETATETTGATTGATTTAGDTATGGTTGSMTTTTGDPTSTTAPGESESESESGGDEGVDACAETVLPPRRGATILVSPGEPGRVVVDGATTTLRAVIQGTQEGDTVLLEDGVYTFAEAMEGQFTGVYITTAGITLRSLSGDPTAVILDGEYHRLGGSSAVISIDAPGVVIADIGVRRSIFHLVHLWAKADEVLLHNLDLVDGGQQFVKSSSGGDPIADVEIACSHFRMTAAGRDNVWGYGSIGGSTACYTGGIDTHRATHWTVRDSVFEGIYCDPEGPPRPAHGQHPELRDHMTYTGGLAEHAIHMWDSEAGTGHLLTRNRIIDCARGIGLGMVSSVYGTTISNNMISSRFPANGSHDVGIIVERAHDTLVAHNTVYFSDPGAYGAGIEYRWGETSNLRLHGNLSNRQIRARDGATAALSDNQAEEAPAAWFVDPVAGDLHLAECRGPGEAAQIPEVTIDFDSEPRSQPTVLGADQCPG